MLDEAQGQGRRPAALLHDLSLLVPGLFVPTEAYVRGLWAAVRRAGGLIIVDEVQCGLGRTGKGLWGFEAVGAVPDIVTVSTSSSRP